MSSIVEPAVGVGVAERVSPSRRGAVVSASEHPRSRSGLLVLVWIVGGVLPLGYFFALPLLSSLLGAKVSDSGLVYTASKRSFLVTEDVKGELKAKNTKEIKSRVEGRTTIVQLVEEGTTVAEGDLLVKLASDKIEDKVRREEANLASAVAGLEAAEKDLEILLDENESNRRKKALEVKMAGIELKKYIEGDMKKLLMDAELEVERTKQVHANKVISHNNTKELFAKKFKTKNDLRNAKFNLLEAEGAMKKAKLGLKILKTYSIPQETERLESALSEAEKELERVKKSGEAKEAQKHAEVEAKRANLLNTQGLLKKLREQMAYTEMRAPSPGIVVYHSERWNNQRIMEGAEVYERQTLVDLPDPSVMIVTVRIHEAKTHKVQVGQVVHVEVEGVPDEVFTGHITKIAPLADSKNQWLNPDLKEYETEILLDDFEADLKPGATARVAILIAELEDVVAIPVQAVFSRSGRHFVFKPDGGDGTPTQVELGESSAEYTEVVGGLAVGDQVMMAINETAQRALADLVDDEADAAGEVAAVAQVVPKKKRGRRGGGGVSRGGGRGR